MDKPDLSFLFKCPNYESYLDQFIKAQDNYYLRDINQSRMIVKLGYRSTNQLYTSNQFMRIKYQLLESLVPKRILTIFSNDLTLTDPVLIALAEREILNQQKLLSTIIFMKHRNKSGMDITGFIDYQHSLNRANNGEYGATDWEGVFKGQVKLKPKKNDLSYYDWNRRLICYNNSDNYIVVHDRTYGLVFMYRGDRRKISVDRNNPLRRNCQYIMVYSAKYGHVVFMDHVSRKKI